MSTAVTTNRISHILQLLGPAVLLPWPSGSKGGHRKWKHLQLADMDQASQLTKLERAGNIGVALGQASNGLVTVDLDQDSSVDAFLAANPLLANTLRTRAARGCNLWLRCPGEYPRTCSLTDPAGNKVGEWRADGSQTIIAGIHPSGVPYQFVVEKPLIIIGYNAIIWPKSILPPDATESQRVRGDRRVEEKEVVCVSLCCEQLQPYIPTELLSQIAPMDYHRNNASLFKLARLMRSYEKAVGRPATAQELQFAFDRWSFVARRLWRRELGRDDYYAEFLEVFGYARIGLDENPIEVALSRAKASPLPQVQGFTDERVRLLVAACRELQKITANSAFFLPTRKLGELLGAHWTQVARWLQALAALGIIHLAPGEVRRRRGNRSPRYYYGHGPAMTTSVALTNGDQPSHGHGVIPLCARTREA